MDMDPGPTAANLDEASILCSNNWTYDRPMDPRRETDTLVQSVVGISGYFPSGNPDQPFGLLPGHSAVYNPVDSLGHPEFIAYPTPRGREDEIHTVAEKDVTRPLTDDNVTIYPIGDDELVVAFLYEAEPSQDPALAASMVSSDTIRDWNGVEPYRLEIWKRKEEETGGSLAQSAGGATQSKGSKRQAEPESESELCTSYKRPHH